jgi:hypothetical protein
MPRVPENPRIGNLPDSGVSQVAYNFKSSHTLTQHLDLDVPSGRVFLSILRLACIRSGVGGPLGVLNHQGSVGINSLPPIDGQHRSVYEAIQIGLE